MKPKRSSCLDGDAPAVSQAAEFVAFVNRVNNADLASMYSAYRFLAELGDRGDLWKRDVCQAELDRRFAAKPPDK